ncbi:hypothetical protein CC86DRAFT_154072 [Ophiobolus disseminans]|uniref:Heterokaryon incompatibility domain-containing protein n=1 Tax=Ophiobolus disseminans TaxID=1469910 RepID=A0A6A6ZCT2_9PLEO|nr:hypothetical protein CC86DRAFT_154072 [Ophiobolus disseminans]
MFRWYRDATVCVVWMPDCLGDQKSWSVDCSYEEEIRASFKRSRWFTRGWTLQELLAPQTIKFYGRNETYLGDRTALMRCIQEVTGITSEVLQGAPLSEVSIDERLSWMKGRNTEREEDQAYSLMGLFDIHMPLLYGEGGHRALNRLRKEIDGSYQGEKEAENRLWKDPWNRLGKMAENKAPPGVSEYPKSLVNAAMPGVPSARKRDREDSPERNPAKGAKAVPEKQVNTLQVLDAAIFPVFQNDAEDIPPSVWAAESQKKDPFGIQL